MDDVEYESYVPEEYASLLSASDSELKSSIPELARNPNAVQEIQRAVSALPTNTTVHQQDARTYSADQDIELIVTSPPYFDLKDYSDGEKQIGNVDEYDEFLEMLDNVWETCYQSLIPGGRMCVIVGDVLRSRREHGRHRTLPLHSELQRRICDAGFDALTPIIWHKIGNAELESGDSARFLGKPYEPGAIVKNDIEYILLFRKPGGYRSPTTAERILSVIGEQTYKECFQQIWNVTGEGDSKHPAPFPEELPHRLIQMFSFVGDTVLDPFAGTGTTAVAANKIGRNAVAVELEDKYADIIRERVSTQQQTLGAYKYKQEE